MTVQYIAKGSAQHTLAVKASVFNAKGTTQYLLTAWPQLQAKGNAQHALAANLQQETQGNAEHILNAYLLAQAEGTTQYTLPIYRQAQTRANTQFSLTAWVQQVAKGDAQQALNIYHRLQTVGNTQYKTELYRTLLTQGSAQYAVNAYAVLQAAGSSQYALQVVEQMLAAGTTQWVLDAATQFYAWAINLETKAVSKYDNYNLGSLSGEIGAGETGIYSLYGDDDAGTPILGFIESGKLDFREQLDKVSPVPKSTFLKEVPDLYLGLEGGPIDIFVTAENTGAIKYLAKATKILETQKVPLASGAESRYWVIKIANKLGSKAVVDDIQIPVTVLSRKR